MINFNNTTPTDPGNTAPGLWQTDGSNISVYVAAATTANAGVVRPDGSTVTIANGVISAVGGGGGSNVTLEHNGNLNSSQSVLNLISGNNIVITDTGNGNISISSTASGGGSNANVTFENNGNLNSSQTVLNLVSGNNIVISDTGNGNIQIASTSSGGGGYSAGNVPAVVQSSFTTSGGNSATFTVAPASGHMLVAMWFNPTSGTVASGWTLQASQGSGTDFCVIATKVAGGSESATQTPISGTIATGALVIWEISGQNANTAFLLGSSQPEQVGITSIAVLYPNSSGCLGLAAVSAVPTPTIVKAVNIGTQDVLSNSGNRYLVAGHTDLSKTPMAGIAAVLSASGGTKAATCLITS